MKSIYDLEKSVFNYVSRNLPLGLPEVSKFIRAYILSLLSSDEIRELLNLLDRLFGDDVEHLNFNDITENQCLDFSLSINSDGRLELDHSDLIPQFYLDKLINSLMYTDTVDKLPLGVQLHIDSDGKLIYDSLVSRYTREVDALNFILVDFCSIAGVLYRPEYKDAIIRSFIRKDLAFFNWLFKKYFGRSFSRVTLLYGGRHDVLLHETDESFGFTDSDFYTDMYSSGQSVLVVIFNLRDKVFVENNLRKYSDLFYLVMPARVSLRIEYR